MLFDANNDYLPISADVPPDLYELEASDLGVAEFIFDQFITECDDRVRELLIEEFGRSV